MELIFDNLDFYNISKAANTNKLSHVIYVKIRKRVSKRLRKISDTAVVIADDLDTFLYRTRSDYNHHIWSAYAIVHGSTKILKFVMLHRFAKSCGAVCREIKSFENLQNHVSRSQKTHTLCGFCALKCRRRPVIQKRNTPVPRFLNIEAFLSQNTGREVILQILPVSE